MIRLKDIAARAGVSLMTVSKVLRDAPDVSKATKERIRSLTQQMGYVPDSMAQGLRTRRTRLLGLVISATTDPVFARIVMRLEERAQEQGYELILAHSHGVPKREELIIRRLLARRVDGLFIAPADRLAPSAPIFDALRERTVPVVILGHRPPFCGTLVCVDTDDAQGSQTLTAHLLELGHRRIAFFKGPPAAPWARERFDGYRQGLRDFAIDVDDALVFQAGSSIEEGREAVIQMLAESACPTAIQAANDLVAIGAASHLLNLGLRIPENISVTGFGNIMTSEYFRVPLTTVRQPQARLGLAAMDLMLRLLRGQSPSPERLSTELILRSSTAAPPAAIEPIRRFGRTAQSA